MLNALIHGFADLDVLVHIKANVHVDFTVLDTDGRGNVDTDFLHLWVCRRGKEECTIENDEGEEDDTDTHCVGRDGVWYLGLEGCGTWGWRDVMGQFFGRGGGRSKKCPVGRIVLFRLCETKPTIYIVGFQVCSANLPGYRVHTVGYSAP